MKTITVIINGKETEKQVSQEVYDEVMKEEEFMPMPEERSCYYSIGLEGNVITAIWDNYNIEKERYKALNAYTNRAHAECMSKIVKHQGEMVRKYGFDREVSYLHDDNIWKKQSLTDENVILDQIFTPTVISSKATPEEKAYRVELINELKTYLPLK